MDRKTLAIALLLIASATTVCLISLSRPGNNQNDALQEQSDREPAVDASMDTASEEQAVDPEPSSGQKTRAPIVFCDRRPECKDDPFMPVSQEELAWMRAHGYPTKEESERLTRLSDTELEAEAKRGVLTAMTELGRRMIERGDRNGLSWYLRAKDHGSIYAYYLESDVEMNPSGGHGFIEAGAFLRVAYILGDHKAGTALLRFFEKNRLGMIEMDAIDRRANELYQTYAKNRQPTPRPR